MDITLILDQVKSGELSISELVELQKVAKNLTGAISEQKQEALGSILMDIGQAISDVDAPEGVKFTATRVVDDHGDLRWEVVANSTRKRSATSENSGEGPKIVDGGRYRVISPDGDLIGTYSSLSSAGRAVQSDRGMFAGSCHGSKFWSADSNNPASGETLNAHGYFCECD